MPERADQIEAFLGEAGWQSAQVTPIAGDMSTRRYSRLARHDRSAILMDAESPMQAFAEMTAWLRQADLSAPEILAADPEAGLLILEDFGSVSLKSVILDHPDRFVDLFRDCADLLLTIRAQPAPALSQPDAATLVEWTELADQHYRGIQPQKLTGFRTLLRDLLDEALKTPATVSLRDFHTENLMWLHDRPAPKHLGLLDYQDAFLTHPAYDLMSLLTDARLLVPGDIREATITHYLTHSGDDPERFRTAFDALSAQRNLRILGIFARAGKHMAHAPNTHGYFVEALNNPAFDPVRDDTLAAVPPPGGTA